MNDLKKQNRFFAFLKANWQQTRLYVKIFLVAVFIMVLLVVMQYVTLYLYISSGGLNSFAGNISSSLYLGLPVLILCFHLWALICLIFSARSDKKLANFVLVFLGTILMFSTHYLCIGSSVSEFFGQPDKNIIRYYAHNTLNVKKLNEFSQEIQSLSTDEKFTFTEQPINDLSEKLLYYGGRRFDTKYFIYNPNFDFNKNLLGLKPSEIHTDVVILFQSENDESSFSDSNNISVKWHFDRGSLIVFGDGRLEFIKKENFKNLRWKP